MPGRWTPELRLHETGNGCRLTLAGVTHGNGHTLQEAADDLIARLTNVIVAMRSSGFRMPPELGPPDRRVLDFLWELGELMRRGVDIRDRVLGLAPHDADDAAA